MRVLPRTPITVASRRIRRHWSYSNKHRRPNDDTGNNSKNSRSCHREYSGETHRSLAFIENRDVPSGNSDGTNSGDDLKLPRIPRLTKYFRLPRTPPFIFEDMNFGPLVRENPVAASPITWVDYRQPVQKSQSDGAHNRTKRAEYGFLTSSFYRRNKPRTSLHSPQSTLLAK
jgi:hypothetical protein